MNPSKNSFLVSAFFVGTLSFSSSSFASPEWFSSRATPPIVSPSWVRENSSRLNMVVLDVRPAQAYANGHIPNAISAPFQVPFSTWITMKDDLLLEIPAKEELFASLGALGITPSSWVVVVSAPNEGEPASYGFSAATRVADTLIYAGVPNVSVLDGGYANWVRDSGATTTVVPTVTSTTFVGRVRENMFVSTEYVKEHLGRSVVVDARDAEVYFGATVEPFASKPGHIPSAKSLPTPWLWSSDGIYKDTSILRKMAFGATGWSGAREIIVYCGVGGYASSAWFVLSQVLGYPNVKFYDGSAQLWAKTEVMVPYRWE
jgi:thiosulfate/3-mercaptopyruvate sulfurtransferase